MGHHPPFGLPALLVATLLWNPTTSFAADGLIPFEGEKSAWHDGFDRYDYVMDDETLAITPFRRAEGEGFGVKTPESPLPASPGSSGRTRSLGTRRSTRRCWPRGSTSSSRRSSRGRTGPGAVGRDLQAALGSRCRDQGSLPVLDLRLLDRRPDPLVARNVLTFFRDHFRKGVPSSIDELEWGSPILMGLAELTSAPALKVHSIIAVRPGSPPGDRTDGLVSYASAHVDGVASEKVVATGHLCQDHPEVIAQVRRILAEHSRP